MVKPAPFLLLIKLYWSFFIMSLAEYSEKRILTFR